MLILKNLRTVGYLLSVLTNQVLLNIFNSIFMLGHVLGVGQFQK
jgi:hypothetical protein